MNLEHLWDCSLREGYSGDALGYGCLPLNTLPPPELARLSCPSRMEQTVSPSWFHTTLVLTVFSCRTALPYAVRTEREDPLGPHLALHPSRSKLYHLLFLPPCSHSLHSWGRLPTSIPEKKKRR